MTKFSEKFDGYILAGGKSSRMKSDKAFLEFGGETFLARAARTISSVCKNRVKIVLNRTQADFIERLPDRVPHIFDVYENRGALGGIHAALQDCQRKWMIILAVDLPLVTSEAIKNLARIALESKDYAAIVPLQSDGRPQSLCAGYRVEDCLPKLENLLNETDSASVRDFLEFVPTRFIEQSEFVANTGEDLFFNVNRPADFHFFVSLNQQKETSASK